MWNFPVRPAAASEHAANYDLLFNAILALTIFFTIVVGLMVLILAFRYRRGSRVDRRNPLTHHLGLEMVWLGAPLVLALGIFGWSAVNYVNVRETPEDAMEIFVIGKQWMWHAQHMNGIRENQEMTVPLGRPVKVTMISQDVIHALYLPEFRAQYHVVPGRYTTLSFTATKPGTFLMLCAMHCGTQHSEMVGYVHVLPEREYNEWLASGGNRFRDVPMNLVAEGQLLFEENGCANCHGARDSERGPSLYGIYGDRREFTNAAPVIADENYLRESILDPWNRITEGYTNTMPAYQGQLGEREVLALIRYIRSLGGGVSDAEQAEFREPQLRNQNPTDVANRQASAGAQHAIELEQRRR